MTQLARKRDGAFIIDVNPWSQGIKLELFIFDMFHTASRVALLEVSRADEFAPVKVSEPCPQLGDE
jgi:hypothetical protein